MRNINFLLSGIGVVLIPEALWDAISRLDHSQQQDVVKAWTAPYTATTPMAEYTIHNPPLKLPKALWDIVGWIHVDISNPIMELWVKTHQRDCETCGWHVSGSGCGEPEFLRTKCVTCGQHEQWKPKTTAMAEVPGSGVDNRSLVEVLHAST